MNPKMTLKDASYFLGLSPKRTLQALQLKHLNYFKSHGSVYFGYSTAKNLFNLDLNPKVVAFQIVKGGTGKTSLAQAFAVRANLYGLRVLCLDLDQQGNLTHTFDVNAEALPVMVDILAEGYTYQDAITRVYPGLDLIASRIENALLDDVIQLKKLPLKEVYREPIQKLKKDYDLIVIDCPPNLGQSVAAITLASDLVVSPVVPERFALEGLKMTYDAIQEIQRNYQVTIPFKIVVNKYDLRTKLSKEAVKNLKAHLSYSNHLLDKEVRLSQEFPNMIAKGLSIYDSVKPSMAKTDIDELTKTILGLKTFEQFKEVERRLKEKEMDLL